MQYNKMKIAVGLFVLTLSVIVLFSLYFLLAEKGTFDKRYNYHFITSSASSFSIGMPLKFSGFDIGVIDKIALMDNGSVDMVFSVTQENRKWINKNTTLTLKKPLIGSPHIEVKTSLNSELLVPNSALKITMSDDINDMISKLEPAINKITNIITNIDILTSNFAKDDSDFLKTIANIEIFTKRLATDKALLSTLTGDENSTKNIIKALNKTDKIMKEIYLMSIEMQKITSSLDKKVLTPSSTTIKDLDKVIIDVKRKLEMLNSTVKTIGSYDKDLIKIKTQVSVGLEKSNKIMDKIDILMQDDLTPKVTLP